MKILCIGEALIDMICTDKGRGLSEGDHFLKKAGGAPTNVAAAIASLGGDTSLVAKVGADPFGQHLVQVMQSFGVNTSFVLQDPAWFTTFAFVSLMENGERDFYFNRGADGQLNSEEVAGIDLSAFGLIHFGSATGFLPGPLQAAYQLALQKALAQNNFISFDPNYRHLLFRNNIQSFIDQSWNFIKHCDFFKVSDEEAILLTGSATVQDAATIFLERSNAIFCITLGSEGTLLGFNKKLIRVESIPVTPVDTTGAGDAFVGAVLFQISQLDESERASLKESDWKKIVFNANKAGAITCEYMGAMESFKHLSKKIFE